jgi:hypothetical protein
MSEEEKSEVDKLLEKAETISPVQYRKETSGGGRSTEYEKFQDFAQNLEKGGDKKKIAETTESQVSSIRTQIEKLNPEGATEKKEKEFLVTRRKITENGEDVTDEDGNQLFNLYLSRQEPKKPVSKDEGSE